jgi:hypothetical protein
VSLFSPTEGPRVFALPPGADFSAALVAGLEARLKGQPPEAMARIDLWVNTQRARRSLVAAFAAGPPRLLPRIRVVTTLATDPLAPLPAGPPHRCSGDGSNWHGWSRRSCGTRRISRPARRPSTSPTASRTCSTRCRARASTPPRWRRSMPASTPRTGSAA